MKKILGIIILCSALILNGCSFEDNSEKISKLEEENKKLEKKNEQLEKNKLENKRGKDIFKKKQECNKLYDEIKSRIKNFNKNNPNTNIHLKKIFFSPKINQCVYIDLFEDPGLMSIKRLKSVESSPGAEPINDISCFNWIYKYKDGEKIRKNGDCSTFNKKVEKYKSFKK